MKKIVILILWLSAWHCGAEVDTNNFPPFEKGTNNFSPFEAGKPGEFSDILPPDAAFMFSAYMESPEVLVAHWQIANGYYLYRDKYQFALNGGGELGKPEFPLGNFKDDIKYGRVEVYEQRVEIKLPVSATDGLESLTLATTYQGCAEDRMCYPPIQKTALVTLPETTSSTQVVAENEIAEKPDNNFFTNPPLETEPNSGWLGTPSTYDSLDATIESGWSNSSNENAAEFLKVEEAFVFSAEFPNSSSVLLRWQIADGYYLYRDKLEFSLSNGGIFDTPQMPPSISKKDPNFGEVQIYKQSQLEITIPVQTEELQNVSLTVKYQGCAIAGLCYPPMTKVVALGKDKNISEQNRLANLLASANVFYTMMMFFGLGLLLAFTPCVFPMIPILSSIIVGQGKQVTTYKAFIMSFTYVLAMAFTYAIVGALTGLLGENLQAAFQNPWVLVSFALVFVALSFSMFGFYELQLPNALQTKLTNLSNSQQGGTLLGVAIMGVLSALIVGPCVAAPLVGALIYIGQTGDWILGGSALFSMSLGMGAPLIIVGISAGHFLPKAGEWMDNIKAVFGVMLLAVAIWMLDRILPGQITMLLWACLLIISALYMGALDRLSAGVSGWRKLKKGLGLIVLIYGALLMIGAAGGNVNPLQPLHNLRVSGNITIPADNISKASQFKTIKGIEGLERELAIAKNKPVMLDFYADWCVSCKEMEHFTFADAGVQEILANFVLLQADVTLNDEQDKALSKHFGIFGPPAILFFDSNGQEQQTYRVVGFMPAAEFRQHLIEVIQP